MTEICQCTISSEEDDGLPGRFDARDIGAPWCNNPASKTMRLSYAERTVNVWVCDKHYDEYVKWCDL